MKILLAPMEGLIDFAMRDLLTKVGGLDGCVTEFLRVTSSLHPNKNFWRICPELHQHATTASGCPVYFQLLGNNALYLASNARQACALGAYGADLNFGCPSNVVNRHGSGASLLKSPEKLKSITRAVRETLSPEHTLSVKMRLGYTDASLFCENICAIEEAGANWITVHARTREQMFKAPAEWHIVGQVAKRMSIPIFINGDIWSLDDYIRASAASGCADVMLGRGLLVQPKLAMQIKAHVQGTSIPPDLTPNEIVRTILGYTDLVGEKLGDRYTLARVKQWLKLLACFGSNHEWFCALFDRAKRTLDLAELEACLQKSLLE